MSSSKKPVSLYLVRLGPAIWAQFWEFYVNRDADHRPHMPEHGVWIATNEQIQVQIGVDRHGVAITEVSPRLVAGVCLFPAAHGPYCFTEHVSTNPLLPRRVTHRAVRIICDMVRAYGCMVNKTPACFPMHKGVERVMQKSGYQPTKIISVMYPPIWLHLHTEPGSEEGETDTERAPAIIEAAQ